MTDWSRRAMSRLGPYGASMPKLVALVVALALVAPLPAMGTSLSATVPAVLRAPVQGEADQYRQYNDGTVRMSLEALAFESTPDDLSTAGDIDLAFRRTNHMTTNANTVTVPWGGIAVAVVHSRESPLVLTMELCARIFGGDVRDWMHEDMLALNPHLAAPSGSGSSIAQALQDAVDAGTALWVDGISPIVSGIAPITLHYPSVRDDAAAIFEAEMHLASTSTGVFNATWLYSDAAFASSYEAILQAVEADPLSIGIVPFLTPYVDVQMLTSSFFPARTSSARPIGVARFRDISGFDVTLDASLGSIEACVDVEAAIDTGVYDLGRESYGCYPISSTVGIVADRQHSSSANVGCDRAARLVDVVRWFTGIHDGRDARQAAAALRPSGVFPIAAKSRLVEVQISEVLRNVTCDTTSLLATFDLSCRSTHVLVTASECSTSLEQIVSFSWDPLSFCDPSLATSVALPPPQTRTCDYIKSGSIVMVFATACFCAVAGLTLLLMAVIIVHRRHAACEHTFSSDLLFLTAALMVSVNIINVIGENNEGVCLWRTWCTNITSCFFIAAIFHKIWRTERYYNRNANMILEKLFSATSLAAQMQRKRAESIQQRIEDALNAHVFKLGDANGYSIVGALVCVDVLILALWSAVAPPGVDTGYDLVAFTDRTLPVTSCGGENKSVFVALSYGYKLVLAFYTLMISSKIYNVRSEFNEIRLLSSVMPTCIITGTVLFIVVGVGEHSAPTDAIVTVCLWTCTLLFSLLAVFHLRLWKIFPTAMDDIHHSLCCCLSLPSATERMDAQPMTTGSSAPAQTLTEVEAIEVKSALPSGSNVETLSPVSPTTVEAQGGGASSAVQHRALSGPHSLTMMDMAMQSMTKRLMEKDAAIAARDTRIAKLEEQLSLVYKDLEGTNSL